MNSNQILHAPSEILFGSPISNFDMPPTCQKLQKHERIASTFTAILKIITPWFSIPDGQR
jgi:hypothetical protein